MESGEMYFAQVSDEQGHFAVYGVPMGAFTVRAQDSDSGLMGAATGSLVDATIPIVLNIALQPAGMVSGVVRNRDNLPVVNAEVYVRSSALDVDRYVMTDANGTYSVNRVAFGDISVIARDPSSNLVGNASGHLESNEQPLSLDITLPVTGSISGKVLGLDGVTAISNAPVTLTTMESYGPFGVITLNTVTDSNGQYTFSQVPVGAVVLLADGGNFFGKGAAQITADNAVALNITLGAAVLLPYDLNGSDASRYDVQGNGTLNDGGFNGAYDAYDGAYYLDVDGGGVPYMSVADMQMNGRELLLSGWSVSGVQVSRQIYVPQGGGFARFLEVLANPGDAAITVPVRVSGNLGSDGDTQVRVAASATGNRYVVTSDAGYDPSLAHVFAGSGAVVATDAQFSPLDDNFSYSWPVTVPAHGSVSLLHFAVQRNSNNWSEAQAQAEALANMTQPGMFDGLSAIQKASIQNFAVSP